MRKQWIPGSLFPPPTESLGTRLLSNLSNPWNIKSIWYGLNDWHTYKHSHTTIVKLCAGREARKKYHSARNIVHTSTNASNTPSGPEKLERPIITQVCGLCQHHSWLVSYPTVHSGDKHASSGNQCTLVHRHNDVYKVAFCGKSYLLQMTPHRNSNASNS